MNGATFLISAGILATVLGCGGPATYVGQSGSGKAGSGSPTSTGSDTSGNAGSGSPATTGSDTIGNAGAGSPAATGSNANAADASCLSIDDACANDAGGLGVSNSNAGPCVRGWTEAARALTWCDAQGRARGGDRAYAYRDCHGFNVINVSGTDTNTEFYYEVTTGALVGIQFSNNFLTSCVGGVPPSIALGDCTSQAVRCGPDGGPGASWDDSGTAPATTAAVAPFADVAIPASIAAPGGTAKLKLHAIGSEIYQCRFGSGPDTGGYAPRWQRVNESATLYDDNNMPQGTLGPEGYWRSKDGSTVIGAPVKFAAPLAGGLPWVLFGAVNHSGTGVFSDVKYVQEVNTVNGLYPSYPIEGCNLAYTVDGGTVVYMGNGAADAAPVAGDAELSVPYTADYYFYQ